MDETVNPVERKRKRKSPKKDDSTKQIRGSSLLLLGKFLSIGINLATQVMMVRYLSKADFGAWGYALAIVTFFQTICTLGLARSQTRFIPIYHEKEEYDKLFGTIALIIITIVSTSILIISAIFLAPELIAKLISGDSQPVSLLFIMVFLVPVDGIDRAMEGMFASFVNPKAIFFRKYILAPVLRLGVVVLLILMGSTVFFLAYGYLAASIIGVLIYIVSFYFMLKKEGLLPHLDLRNINIPAKEIFAFTIPLMTSDLLSVIMHTSDTLMLGYFHDTVGIASYQAILPAVRINKMVMTSFAFLFTPLAARLFAKNDTEGINDLYWRTAIWLAVLTFPMFALTFSLAEPVTLSLYGERYADSWVFLSMLGFAYYFNAALGFNGMTLKVIGKVRYIMYINLAAAVINIIGNLALIPPYGALGATISTAGTMIVHNILKQAGLKYLGGLRIFDMKYLSLYFLILGFGLGIFLMPLLFDIHPYIQFAIAGLLSFAVLRLCQEKLDVEATFPELLRLPFMDKILGVKRKS